MNSTYQEILPSENLKDLVHSFWHHNNYSDQDEVITIVPDYHFKIIFYVKEGLITSYFMTGLWSDEKIINIPAGTSTFGCRLKVLAPEYLLGQKISILYQSRKELTDSYLSLNAFDLSSFEVIVQQWEKVLLQNKPVKNIDARKLRLSQLLDKMRGLISVQEVSNQIYWSNRQINRYLNEYLGVSLKQFLNIQRVYYSLFKIRSGQFYPDEDGFYDQAHFIREVRKHTGSTPKKLFRGQNDQFLQVKNMRPR